MKKGFISLGVRRPCALMQRNHKASSKKVSTHFKQVLLRPQYHQRIDRQVIHMYSQAALHLPGRQLRALPQYHTRASRGFKHSIFHENCEKASAALNGESIFHPEKNPSFLFPCVPHCVLNFQILSINHHVLLLQQHTYTQLQSMGVFIWQLQL